MTMMYFELHPPAKWRMGYSGAGENAKEFYADCADCEAKEPEIAGILAEADNPTFSGIALIVKPHPKYPESKTYHAAMFCQTCFDKRVADERAKQAQGIIEETDDDANWCKPAQGA